MSVSRISRVLLHAVMVAGVLNLSGCYTYRTMPAYQNPLPDSLYVYSEISEDPVWIHHPVLEGEEVVGWFLTRTDSLEVRVPATQQVRELDGKKTALVSALGAGVFFALVLILGEGAVGDTRPGS